MYKDYRYINAGQNEIYRYGHKAVEKVQACLTPNDQGWLSIPVDGGKYWTIGTSEGKYGRVKRGGRMKYGYQGDSFDFRAYAASFFR